MHKFVFGWREGAGVRVAAKANCGGLPISADILGTAVVGEIGWIGVSVLFSGENLGDWCVNGGRGWFFFG